MKQLLPEYSPVTFGWGFVEAPLGTVTDFFLSWRNQSMAGETVGRVASGQLAELIQNLDPLTSPPTKDLLVETRSRWTAFFDNSVHGADAASPMSYVARELGCRALAVACAPNTLNEVFGRARGSYGAVQFELFGPTQAEFLNYVRSVAATNDGGRWVFVASGSEQPFEEPEQYKKRVISERFTPEMLERYARALDIDLFDPSFYGPNAYVVTKAGLIPQVTLTLHDAHVAIEPIDAL